MGFFTFTGIGHGGMGKRVTIGFSFVWFSTLESPITQKELVCFRVHRSFPWLFSKKLNDFHVYSKINFFSQLFFFNSPIQKSQIKSSGNATSPEMDAKMAARTWHLLAQRMGFVLELKHRNRSQSPDLSRQSQDINRCPKASSGEPPGKALSLGILAQPNKTWGVCWHCWWWLWPWQHSAVVRKVRGCLPRHAAQPCSCPQPGFGLGGTHSFGRRRCNPAHRTTSDLCWRDRVMEEGGLGERQPHILLGTVLHWSAPASLPPSIAPLNCSRKLKHFKH